MTDQGHQELAEVLSAAKGKVALSGYRCELMDRAYAGWNRHDAYEKRCHSSKALRAEALWTNY